MRKLMIAAAIVCAAVAAHADEVVVKFPLKFGFNPMTVCLVDSGASALSIQNIKPTGEDVSGKIFLVTVNDWGEPADTYQWFDKGEGEGPCWVDSDWGKVEGKSFDSGKGFIVQCNCADGTVNLQMTGEPVKVETITVGLRAGMTQAGNPFYQTIDINSIKAAGDDVSDNVVIRLRDSQGKLIVTYQWINWGGESFEEECWVDDDFNEIPEGTVTFGPGVGFSVEGSSEDQSIVLTNPL